MISWLLLCLVGQATSCLLTRDELLGETSTFSLTESPHVSNEFDRIIQEDVLAAKEHKNEETPFHHISDLAGNSLSSHRISLTAQYQLLFLERIRKKFSLNLGDMHYYLSHGRRIIKPCPHGLDPSLHPILTHYDQCPYPSDPSVLRCDPDSPYRTIDGSCNNLRHPLWGRANMPHVRMAKPDYADGFDSPRRAFNDKELPSARFVSNSVFNTDSSGRSKVHTLLLMSIGQLIDHEVTRTPVTKLSSHQDGSGEPGEVECGQDGCSTKGKINRACFPIPIPSGDPDFKDTNKKCIPFVRSAPVPSENCDLSPREQLNEVTPYVDASMLYGSTKKEADELRDSDKSRGKLKMQDAPKQCKRCLQLLPGREKVGDCEAKKQQKPCFLAGDVRVNEQMGLTGVHTIWARYHNHVEEGLHTVNPKWGGERLYQETRKIVGAVWQHIIYTEFLPIMLGKRTMRNFGLNSKENGHHQSYNPEQRAIVRNEFATAAYRVGHSLVADEVPFSDHTYKVHTKVELQRQFEEPFRMYTTGVFSPGSSMDGVLLGQLTTPAMNADNSFSKQLLTFLFTEKVGEPSMDLAALNIQRGRDHGIPSYVKLRAVCGLSQVTDFDDLEDMKEEDIKQLKRTYKSVHDIDLFAGGILETPMSGALVGPTFGCIIASQFRALKVGDRFFYENPYPKTGFTAGQVDSIKQVKLSSVICKTMDNMPFIQKRALLQPLVKEKKLLLKKKGWQFGWLYDNDTNDIKPCRTMPQLDLRQWKQHGKND